MSTTVWTSSKAVPRPRLDLWNASKKPANDPPKFCACQLGGDRHGPDGRRTLQRMDPTCLMIAIRSLSSGMPSFDADAARNTCAIRALGQSTSDE